jgi:hypothetical protein
MNVKHILECGRLAAVPRGLGQAAPEAVVGNCGYSVGTAAK